MAALLSACGLPDSLGRSGGAPPAANPASSSGAQSLLMPVSVPVHGPPPDKPGGADGVLPPLYVNLPSNLVKSISQAPGKGGTVVKMTQVTAAQIPLETNTTWQEVNRQLNVNLQLLVYTVGDYPVKLSTVIASGEL